MNTAPDAYDLSPYQSPDAEFAHLSLKDLLEARELYHIHLMRHPNVVATAIGRYRIRTTDSWPNERKVKHGAGVRRLENSEVRPYSWPCILVFVSTWEDPKKFAQYPERMVPKSLYLPDGRQVPVCVIEAPRESTIEVQAPAIRYPVNNIGPGQPLVAEVQGNRYAATIACLVSDGHRIYALTNRHVTGEAGEPVHSIINGQEERIGESAAKQLTRLPLSTIYPDFPGKDAFLNVDIGLVDLDDVTRWTAANRGLGIMGPMLDFSGINLSLSLIGCHVRGIGAAGGDMQGEIHGLFYRYAATGGFEYVADLFIGPRTPTRRPGKRPPPPPPAFATLPGDSGTLWLLEPNPGNEPKKGRRRGKRADRAHAEYRPLAVQWGRNMFKSAGSAPMQSYALATLLSRICALLEVDPVRDWNLDQTDTWGAIGHFSIAAHTLDALSGDFPKLDLLMNNNAGIISHDDAAILQGDFTGMGTMDFVPMADVPDFFWKPRIAKQGHSRTSEGPNHFADMDQENAAGKTLLDLTKKADFIDPDKWQGFYTSVKDILSGDPITLNHRGLLPFRVWQLFDAMVENASSGDAARFVCAAGVLTHYVGDACQPLHISYLHDGDPMRPVMHTFSRGKKVGQSEKRPLGQGVHSAYEDAMVYDNRKTILSALAKTSKVKPAERIATGFDAAKKTIELMRETFGKLPPDQIVQTYVDVGKGGKASTDALWKAFGTRTKTVMQAGAHLLALLWESAWAAANGESTVKSTKAITQQDAMAIVADPDFVPSMTINKIGPILKGP